MKTRQTIIISAIAALMLLTSTLGAFAQGPADPELDRRVSLQFRDVPIGNALAILFEGINYVPEAGIQGTVSLSLNDVPFTDALQALLKAGGLTARKENNIYYIGPQQEFAEVYIPEVIEPELDIQREKIPEKIPIGFVDVADIGNIFGAQSVGTRAGSMMGGGMMGGGMGGGMMGGGMMGGA